MNWFFSTPFEKKSKINLALNSVKAQKLTWLVLDLLSCFQQSEKKTRPLDVTAVSNNEPTEFLARWKQAPYIGKLSTVCISRYSAVAFDSPQSFSSSVLTSADMSLSCVHVSVGSQSVYAGRVEVHRLQPAPLVLVSMWPIRAAMRALSWRSSLTCRLPARNDSQMFRQNWCLHTATN